jgi:hypothetical protein
VYSAANAGIVGMTKAMAMELWRHGINCNAFCPQGASPGHVAGFAKTLKTLSEAMGKEVTMSAEKKAEIDANHADSEGLAPFLAYLCTDQGKQYTAQVFSVTASGKVEMGTEKYEYGYEPNLAFEDIDGPENGSFAPDTLFSKDLEAKQIAPGDGHWYGGAYEIVFEKKLRPAGEDDE